MVEARVRSPERLLYRQTSPARSAKAKRFKKTLLYIAKTKEPDCCAPDYSPGQIAGGAHQAQPARHNYPANHSIATDDAGHFVLPRRSRLGSSDRRLQTFASTTALAPNSPCGSLCGWAITNWIVSKWLRWRVHHRARLSISTPDISLLRHRIVIWR